jgi:hypothetical protein
LNAFSSPIFVDEPPRARIAAVRIVDMSGSNSWAEFPRYAASLSRA